MNGDFYNLVNKIHGLTEEAPKTKKSESGTEKTVLKEGAEQLGEKYMGWKKTVAAIKKGGSAENPEAVAASIGRDKYGAKRFQKAAAAGKKLGEQGVAEDTSVMVDPRQVTGTAVKPPTLQPELKLPEPKQNQPMVKPNTTVTGTPEKQVNEKAPPGAKAERMVKHIKAGYAKDGKLTDIERRKAYGAAWKAHNAGKVEETQNNESKVFNESFFKSYNKHKTINSLILEAFDDGNGLSIEEKDLKSYIGDKLYTELQKAIAGEGDLSDDLIDMLFDYYDQKGELPPEIINNEMSVKSWLTNKAKTILQAKQNEPDQMEPTDQTQPAQPVKEASDLRKVSGTRYGGSSQENDEEDEDDEKTKKKEEPAVKRGRGRPPKAGSQSTNPEEKRKQKDREEAGKALQSMIVGNQPKKSSKELAKLPVTKHKMKG